MLDAQSFVQAFGSIVSASAGVFAQRAADAWWLHDVHDSVLRRCHLSKEWHPAKIRGFFCAIVNQKAQLLDVDGVEVSGVKGRLGRNLVLLLAASCIVTVGSIASKSANYSLGWKLSEPLAAVVIWMYFAARLHRKTHLTELNVKKKDGTTKCIKLGGERAEDGMPTNNVGEDIGEE